MAQSLLQNMLTALASGEMCTLGDLAEELKVGEPLLEQMLKDLERGGYLQTISISGCGDCTSCPLQERTCKVKGGSRAWFLTEKGRRIAES